MRKIRVICSDPYATDCSSDDEQSLENRRPANGNRVVQEISVSIPAIHQDSLSKLITVATDSSSREDGPINQEINSTVAENYRSLLRAKRPGIQMTEPGKWGVQIYHPMEGTLICLGSYNTMEEATNVYNNKKLEFALLSELTKQQNQRSRHKRQRFVLDDLTIFETATGKWATWTKDPISNVKIWVGVYTTPEVAVQSYCTKKLDTKNASSPIDTEIASFNRRGIKLTKTGKWGVTIQHPSLKSRYWLGSFDTIEEATEVYDKKKAELDAGSGSGSLANQKSCFFEKGALTDGLAAFVINSKGDRVLYKGVRLRQSGRWCAEIKDRIKGKNTYLGTFDTPEEAADAYNKRKRELDEMASNGNKKAKSKGMNPEADDDANVDVIKTEQNGTCLSNSTVTAVGSQNSEGSNNTTNNNNNNNNDKQIPGFSSAAEDEFGCGVINCYGQLIGEYSSMDDELWFRGPGDNGECDVNGTIGGIQDLALDYKPHVPSC